MFIQLKYRYQFLEILLNKIRVDSNYQYKFKAYAGSCLFT